MLSRLFIVARGSDPGWMAWNILISRKYEFETKTVKIFLTDNNLKFFLLQVIGYYLRVTFHMPRDWLKNNQSRTAINTSVVLWGQAYVKDKAVLPFDIWLYYEVILFYPTLASWCNSLNRKGPKRIIRRRQQ